MLNNAANGGPPGQLVFEFGSEIAWLYMATVQRFQALVTRCHSPFYRFTANCQFRITVYGSGLLFTRKAARKRLPSRAASQSTD
jgi:hypothetical protein